MAEFIESIRIYLGQTVTVFTTSGGLSGSGFTGVLIFVDCNCVKLLTDMGAAPACPVGSACTGCLQDYGYGYGYGCGGFNPLGSVVTIPVSAIAAFTHNAI